MAGTQQTQLTDSNTEMSTGPLFTVVEMIDGAIIISRGNIINRWPLRKRYTSFSTNEHLLKRGALIGHTPEETLFLIRYLKGKEDPVVGMVEYYALFGTTIIYISGNAVTTIDISTGEKKRVIESDEKIGPAKILVCEGSLLLVCRKAIHRLELKTSLYTKLRLKVSLNPSTAEAASLGDQVQLVVSCAKGNVYVFETKKMEIIRSMKYFGSSISAIGFWRPEPSILFVLTSAGELMDVDYLNNRILKKNKFPVDNCKTVVALKGKAMVFISESSVFIYSPYTNSISTVYRSHSPDQVSYISVIPDEEPSIVVVPKKTVREQAESLASSALTRSPAEIGVGPAEDSPNERPGRLNVEYSHKGEKIKESPGTSSPKRNTGLNSERENPASLYESFEKFKDSVYKMQADVLKEVFLLKKRLEKIEKSLSK